MRRGIRFLVPVKGTAERTGKERKECRNQGMEETTKNGTKGKGSAHVVNMVWSMTLQHAIPSY